MSKSRTFSTGKLTSTYSQIKRERSHSSKSRRSLLENEFPDLFKTFCAILQIENPPNVKTLFAYPEPGNFSVANVSERSKSMMSNQTISNNSLQPEILAIYNSENVADVNMIVYKNFPMMNNLLAALQKSLNVCQTVTVLKLEFCNLDSRQIKAVKFLLKQNSSIVDLSLNGNPNKYQNFYILLKNTKLLYLSLRFCQINSKGTENIGGCLSDPMTQTLLGLNLSSNYISDDGIQHIADILRTNRRLIYINLADNLITDTGCVLLVEIFQIFPLKHEEIVLRRHRNMAYLLKKKEMIEDYKSKNTTGSTVNLKNLDSAREKKPKAQSRRSSKDRLSASSNSTLKKIMKTKEKNISDLIESQMPKDKHPFMAECYSENKEVYCKGNFKLSTLNLAHNKITSKGLKTIVDMVKYQQTIPECATSGLSTIVLEGNDISSIEMNELEAALDQKMGRPPALSKSNVRGSIRSTVRMNI